MRYAVEWRDIAGTALIGYLLRAADKPALLAVARDVDARLARDPHGEGERIMFARPFVIAYEVDEPNRTVYVDAVGWAGY